MRADLTETERDDLCDALMSYRLHSEGAPERFERYIVPAVERVLTTRVAALTAALDAITAACTTALADHRRGCPTYGLVSAGLIAAIAEEAKR